MAVARPQVQRLRSAGFTGAGGAYKTELGQALGNVARAIERRRERREKAEEKEHERKSNLLGLKARDNLLQKIENARNSGTLPSSSADLTQWGRDLIEQEAAPLQTHDEVAAEEFRVASRATMQELTAAVRKREEDDAKNDLVSLVGRTKLRFESDLPGLLREAMNAKTQDEAESAWGAVQSLHRDAVNAANMHPPGETRDKELEEIESFMNTARFDARVNKSVVDGDYVQFFNSIPNGKDWIGGTDKQAKWSDGVSPAHIASQRTTAFAQGKAARLEKEERAKAARDKESDLAKQRLNTTLTKVNNEEWTPEQGDAFLTAANDPKGAAVVREYGVNMLDDRKKLADYTLSESDKAVGFTQRTGALITSTLDKMEVSNLRQTAILMHSVNVITKDQLETIKALANEQDTYIEAYENDMEEVEKEIVRNANSAFRSIEQKAGLVGPLELMRLAPSPQLAFYQDMKPAFIEFAIENRLDINQTRVLGGMMEAMWEMGKSFKAPDYSAEQSNNFGSAGQVDTKDMNEMAIAKFQSGLKVLAASGVKIETDREMFDLFLHPQLSATLKGGYDSSGKIAGGINDDGSMNNGATIIALEKVYTQEQVATIFERVLLPVQELRMTFAAARLGEVNEDATRKLAEHLKAARMGTIGEREL